MTVAQLRERLSEFDDDMEVYHDWDWSQAYKVEGIGVKTVYFDTDLTNTWVRQDSEKYVNKDLQKKDVLLLWDGGLS